MRRVILPLLAGLLVLTGCASHYVITLTNGAALTTTSKPQLREGAYHFKDAKGQESAVSAGRVREIAPASMAGDNNRPKPKSSLKLQKRKWYLLWLA